MYLKFYQLHKKPFSLAPDPEFLYLSQQHKDALGAIIYGIKERQGFVSVIGEVGTGKTTIVRSYLQKTERNQVLPIFIFNSRISFTELMNTFLREVGISSEVIQKAQSLNEMVGIAYRALLEKARAGHTIVLIIDEAQNMPVETLAKLCVLSNFETAKAKLIQIVLVGQPELQKKLSRHELRQLRQRIAYRALITPLSQKDSVDYMKHRLALVCRGDKALFTERAVKKIVEHSKGVPRIINILSENCLVAGYGLQKKPVSKAIVKQVVAEYEGEEPIRSRNTLSAAFSLLLVFSAGLLLIQYSPELGLNNFFTAGQKKVTQLLLSPRNEPNIATVTPVSDKTIKVDSTSAGSNSNETAEASATSVSNNPLDLTATLQLWRSFTLVRTPEENVAPKDGTIETIDTTLPASLPYQIERLSTHLKVVKKGDTVSSLCQSIYGFVNSQVLGWIKHNNPHIYDLDEIQVNEIILFPAIEQAKILPPANKRSSITREEIVSR